MCLLPLPRYVREPCCKSVGHITNFLEDNFEYILTGAASTAHIIVASEGEKAGLSLYTFDPIAALGGGEKLSTKTSWAGLSALLEYNPVHLTATAYKEIAGLVLAQAALVVLGRGTTGRRRLNSIVPVPQLTVHHPATVREPGWISGTESSNSSRGFGRGGRGGGRGQRRNRGRGRGNRSYPY